MLLGQSEMQTQLWDSDKSSLNYIKKCRTINWSCPSTDCIDVVFLSRFYPKRAWKSAHARCRYMPCPLSIGMDTFLSLNQKYSVIEWCQQCSWLVGSWLSNHSHVMILNILWESDRHRTREGRVSAPFKWKIYIYVHGGQTNLKSV